MKTIMNNKMFKVILLVAIFATTQVSLVRVSAQTTETEKPAVEFVYSSGAKMEIGDSVMIHQDSLRYITGERMSSWVYGVPHQIRQLGTKTKPTGVLLRGIYSWIAQGSLVPLNHNKTQEYFDAIRAAEEEAERARVAAEAAAAAAAEEAARAKMFEEYVEEDTIVEKDTVVPDLPYQVNRFSIGVRGGVAAQSMPSFGFSTMLDLRYAHYWVKSSKSPKLGIMTGVGVGYMQYGQNLTKNNYTVRVADATGHVDYAVAINKAHAINNQVQLEIPVMFSMVTPKGFFLNAGPKLILPAYAGYKQDMSGVTLTATHVEEGVTIAPNDPLMGVVKDAVEKGQNKNAWDVTVGLGAELGYELKIGTNYALDLGVYATYGINTNTYKDATGEILTITAPDAVHVGGAKMHSIMNAGPVNMSYLDAGLKVTFHFDWDNKK